MFASHILEYFLLEANESEEDTVHGYDFLAFSSPPEAPT
jgi:hypothetical protein